MANLLVNRRTRVIHDEFSEERCNVDDLRRSGKYDAIDDKNGQAYHSLIEAGFRHCNYCQRKRARFMQSAAGA